MKVAQVMLGKGFGGAERSFVDLCRALAARGHEVLALCEARADAAPLLRGLTGVETKTIRVRGAWDWIAGVAIKRELRAFSPNVVQMHLARAATLAGPATKALGVPSLAKTHNYVSLKYYRAIDHLVATTHSQFDYLLSEGRSPDELSVIPNFSAFARAEPRARRDEKSLQVVAIGRLVEKKGFDDLLQAARLAQDAGQRLALTIIGDGPRMSSLRVLCGQLELDNVVRFAGWQADVASALCGADVFVLPSRDEPFGIVCLEAMASATPIIATHTAGPSEFLSATTAMLVPIADPPSLAEALLALDRDYPAALARAARASKTFDQRFSESAVVAQYLDLYAQLISATKA